MDRRRMRGQSLPQWWRGGGHELELQCRQESVAESVGADQVIAPIRRRAITSGSPSVIAHHRDANLMYAGWLCVENNCKREFKWRYCILHGTTISCYEDDKPEATTMQTHEVVAVERLHCINRAMLLTDRDGYRLWIHVDHRVQNFERWLAIFSTAIRHQTMRRNGAIFSRPTRLSPALESEDDDLNSLLRCVHRSFTGWLRVRKTLLCLRGGIYSRPRRMYIVLSGRHLSGFTLNIEGRWADLYGQIVAVRSIRDGEWLEVQLNGGTRWIQIAGRSSDETEQWRQRMMDILGDQ